MLNQLLQIKNMIVQDMQMVAAFQDIQADPNVAARTGSLAIENARARWQSFLADLAAWHSSVMSHCLTAGRPPLHRATAARPARPAGMGEHPELHAARS